jgi:hypothetical protein
MAKIVSIIVLSRVNPAVLPATESGLSSISITELTRVTVGSAVVDRRAEQFLEKQPA